MSVITTFEAVPSRLFAIYASLFDSEGGEAKDRIEAWATPPSLSGRGGDDDGQSTTMLFSNTLLEARRLGIVEEVDGKVRLSSQSRSGGRKGADSEVLFMAYMRKTLFDPARAAETQQTAFMLAMTWFLSSSPLRPMNFSEAPQIKVQADLGDHYSRTELTNLSSFQSFLYWARYLGFATIVGGGREAEDLTSRQVFPDPIKAIEAVLPAIFAEANDLAIDHFLARLAAIYPVFESGSVWREYEALRTTPPSEGDRRLSAATSIALQRLADRQRLTLTRVADATARILNFGTREERVSRVALRAPA